MEATVVRDGAVDPGTAPDAALVRVALADLAPDEVTFRLRAALSVADLARSLELEGQQTPVTVRRAADGTLQLISGFRRVEAARSLGWGSLLAVVRADLDDDDDAFRAAVSENVGRRSYSDLDRALVAHRYLARGHTVAAAGELLGLKARQVHNLTALLRLPPEAQAAIADPDGGFTAAHAFVLRAHEGRLAGAAVPSDDDALDWPRWIAVVQDEPLSVSQLKRRLSAAAERPPLRLVDASATSWDDGIIHLRALRLDAAALPPDDRAALRADLERLLAVLADD